MKHSEPPKQAAHPARRIVGIVLALVATAAIGASWLLLDQPVSGWFIDHPSTWHNNAWVDGFRQLGKADVPIWLLLIWSCLTDKWRPTLVTIAALILVGASVCPLKAITRRCRPNMITEVQQLRLQGQDVEWQRKVSFPSGDTAVGFAVATTLGLCLSRLWIPALFASACAIGVLRVTVLAHYPSDALAGAILGVLCGVYTTRWLARLRELDRLHIAGRWRFVALVVLVLVVPLVSPFADLDSLSIFLKVYAAPLAVLVLLGLASVRLKGLKKLLVRSDALWEGAPSQESAVGNPQPKPDSLEEPVS